MKIAEKRRLRPDEAARLLGVSRRTVLRQYTKGTLRGYRASPRRVYIFSESVEEKLKE